MTASIIDELIEHLMSNEQEDLFKLKYYRRFYDGEHSENPKENIFIKICSDLYNSQGSITGSLFTLKLEQKSGIKINL